MLKESLPKQVLPFLPVAKYLAKGLVDHRAACMADGTISEDWHLTRDMEFNSPSTAATFMFAKSKRALILADFKKSSLTVLDLICQDFFADHALLLLLCHGWQQADGNAILADFVLGVIGVFPFVCPSAQVGIFLSILCRPPTQRRIVGVDQDRVGALVEEDDRFLFVLGEGVGHRYSFIKTI